MYISLEASFGSGAGSLILLDAAADEAVSDCRDGGRAWVVPGRNEASPLSLGSGGGKGDIEMLVTEAEWAW